MDNGPGEARPGRQQARSTAPNPRKRSEHMALTRKFLKAMGIEDEKAEEIISAHVETVNGLKGERDALEHTAHGTVATGGIDAHTGKGCILHVFCAHVPSFV